MKKIFRVLFVVVILAAVFAVPVFAQGENPPAPTSPVELPVELQALLSAVIGYLVTQGLKSLSALLKADLSGWAAAITASVVTTVIYFFHAILSAVPVAAQPSVAITLTLIVSILGAFGVHSAVKGKK